MGVYSYNLGAVYMGRGKERFPGRDLKRDLAMHVYISYMSRSVYMERMFIPSRPGKAGSQFAQPLRPTLLGRYYADFANYRVKSSRVEHSHVNLGYHINSPLLSTQINASYGEVSPSHSKSTIHAVFAKDYDLNNY